LAFGLQQGESDQNAEQFCYLWPCNVRTYSIWHRIQTQWRVGGMGERTGLDYGALDTYLCSVERIPKNRQWAETWAGLQAMEAAALEVWAQQRAQAN
jgi:hypothetical protein